MSSSTVSTWESTQAKARELAAHRRAEKLHEQAAETLERLGHLLACMDHAIRAVLTQRQVAGAPEEVPAFAPLLDGLDLAGTVVTADALPTHPAAAEFLVTGKHAHYLFCVKANQPTLLARCERLPWHRVPVLDRTGDRGHGRVEVRTLKAVSVHRFGFPMPPRFSRSPARPVPCRLRGGSRP